MIEEAPAKRLGDEGPVAAPDLQHAERGEDLDRLADGAAAGGQGPGELELAGDAIAGSEPPGQDQPLDGVDDGLDGGPPLRADRTNTESKGEGSRSALARKDTPDLGFVTSNIIPGAGPWSSLRVTRVGSGRASEPPPPWRGGSAGARPAGRCGPRRPRSRRRARDPGCAAAPLAPRRPGVPFGSTCCVSMPPQKVTRDPNRALSRAVSPMAETWTGLMTSTPISMRSSSSSFTQPHEW